MSSFPFTRKLLLPLLLALPLQTFASSGAHWTYQGDNGPDHWGDLAGALENAQCAKGHAQSPIDINMQQVQHRKVVADDLHINYERSSLKLANNGHTIQAILDVNNTLTYKGEVYRLLQFHFHTPSEHQFNHQSYPMEMHLVNQGKDGRLLVLSLLIEEGKKNHELAALWEALPRIEGKTAALNEKTAPDLGKLLPEHSKHAFYQGSLTTPPCTEAVQWVLFEQPIELSHQQIEQFRQLFPDNHRPVQPLNGREVDED